MKLEEYKEWLKKNGNLEELKAYEVAKKIIKYHESEYNETRAELFPRKVITSRKERIEFDLVIKLVFNGKKTTERLIGVEFKENDIQKVIHQAVIRRPYVNYQYIAIRPVFLNYSDIFLLSAYSIGLVLWDEDFVKLLVPSRYRLPSPDLYYIVHKMVKEAVKEKVREELATLNKFVKEVDSE